MELFNKYGVLDRKYQDAMGETERECFNLFLNTLPEGVALGDTRTLFHEFQSGLYSRMCEHVICSALDMRKAEKEAYRGIIIDFTETQRIIDEVNKQFDINSSNIIERIKVVRRISDVGLVEAKNFVEKYWSKKLMDDKQWNTIKDSGVGG